MHIIYARWDMSFAPTYIHIYTNVFTWRMRRYIYSHSNSKIPLPSACYAFITFILHSLENLFSILIYLLLFLFYINCYLLRCFFFPWRINTHLFWHLGDVLLFAINIAATTARTTTITSIMIQKLGTSSQGKFISNIDFLLRPPQFSDQRAHSHSPVAYRDCQSCVDMACR